MNVFARRSVAAAFGFALLAVAPRALADKVAVLAFASAGGGTTSAQLDQARAATRGAVTQLHHTLPSASEMVTAEMAVKDGVADTSNEYRAAGRASSAAWTVAGHATSHGPTYRLELDVCQVETGRVESLAREIDGRQATPQIAEMLALLLRPEGIGTTEPPWEHAIPAPNPAPPAPSQTTTAPPVPPAVVTPPPIAPPSNEEAPLAYAEKHPVAAGVGLGVLVAVKRAENARGSSAAGELNASFGYAIESVRGLEIRAGFAAGVVGPESIALDAGARFVLPIAARARIFAGPEAGIGGFFTLGGDQKARVLLRGALPIVWGATPQVQLELVPEIDYAGGGTTSLFLAGGSVRGVYRF